MKPWPFSIVLWLLYSSPLMAAPGAHGPDGEHLSDSPASVSSGVGRQADGSVFMPMAQQRQLGIRTQLVQRSSTSKVIELNAVVRHHPAGRALVQSSSDGRLDAGPSGLPVSGQRVSAGDVLGYIRYQDSAYELASQNSELIALRSEIEQSQRDLARLRALADLAAAQQREQLANRLQRLKQQEQVLQQGLEQPEVLLAPISGIVHNDNVARGQWVQAGTTLFDIIDPAQLLVEALTSEPSWLTELDTAVLAHAPKLQLTYIGHAARLKQGQIPLYFQPTATAHAIPLLLDQPVRLLAPLKQQLDGLVLPAQAVVRNSANLPVVWIKLSAEQFLPQPVQYVPLHSGLVLVQQGLGSDNRVVVQGASLLNQVR